jgi:hypothetical protein
MPFRTTLPGRYHGGDNDSTAPWASRWIRFAAGAGKFQNCTLAILRPCTRLQLRSWWFLPSLTRAIESGVERLTVHRSAYRNSTLFGVWQVLTVRHMATAHRSGLVRSKGQPSATMVGIDGDLRGFFSIPGASRLRDACLATDQPPG